MPFQTTRYVSTFQPHAIHFNTTTGSDSLKKMHLYKHNSINSGRTANCGNIIFQCKFLFCYDNCRRVEASAIHHKLLLCHLSFSWDLLDVFFPLLLYLLQIIRLLMEEEEGEGVTQGYALFWTCSFPSQGVKWSQNELRIPLILLFFSRIKGIWEIDR